MKTATLRIGAGLSTEPDPERATRAACGEALGALAGETCDLAFLFVSPHHLPTIMHVVSIARDVLSPAVLLGCSGAWIVGGAREVEYEPAISVWAGHFPDTTITPFALSYGATPDGETFLGWPDDIPAGASVLALADPFTFPAAEWLAKVNADHPGLLVTGGLASGGRAPGDHRLIAGHEVRNGGAVGAVVAGRLTIRSLVSQGCKPVGMPLAVTDAERNILRSLGGRTAVERIREAFIAADEGDREAMQSGLHVGRVVDEYKTEFRRGDFLVRNVLGADEASGAIAIGDMISVGETVQFHVRDAASADEDLRHTLEAVGRPAGALLFTCNGRGSNLFGVPDHDAAIVSEATAAPLAGFFCNGELGPVGGRNFLHGFTASLALFYDAANA